MKKKILIISQVFDPEPVVSAGIMRDIALGLSEDFDVVIFKPTPSRPLGFKITTETLNSKESPYQVVVTDSYICAKSSLTGRMRESHSFGINACRYIRQHAKEIDLIYNFAHPLLGAYLVSSTAKKLNIPYLTSVQDIYPESISSKLPKYGLLAKLVNKLLLPIDKFTLKNAAGIHTISEGMADYLASSRKIDRDKFIVVRNWQDESDFINFKDESKIEGKAFTFMYMGNVGPLAGLGLLLEATKLLNEYTTDFRLVIAGSGSAKNDLIIQARKLGLTNVHFWDVPKGMVPKTQSEADIMILPIMHGYAKSSIPSKLPAYMFSARPIIACVDEDSDTAQSVTGANAGWVIKPENPYALMYKMKEAMTLSARELRTKGDNGREYSLANFGKGKNLSLFIHFIKSFI